MKKLDLIMLIDDDTITNFLNEMLINEMEITNELVVATNGQQALEEIASCHKRGGALPDLILLDVNMPVLNGFEFLKLFNESDIPNKESPLIVMLTTSLNIRDKERAQHLNVKDYLSKPLTKESMRQLLEKHFKLRI